MVEMHDGGEEERVDEETSRTISASQTASLADPVLSSPPNRVTSARTKVAIRFYPSFLSLVPKRVSCQSMASHTVPHPRLGAVHTHTHKTDSALALVSA